MNKKKQRSLEKLKKKQEAFAKIQQKTIMKNIDWSYSRIDNPVYSCANASHANSYFSGDNHFENGDK